MKKLVKVVEVDGEGLDKLIGEKVTLLCSNYFYTGVLIGVNADDVMLEDPSIVYETGDWSGSDYSDVQKLPSKELYVRISHIESYGVLK
jgi:hypothetical protein